MIGFMIHKLAYDYSSPRIFLLRGLFMLMVLVSMGFSAEVENLPEPQTPAIQPAHQTFLTRLVRRTIRDVTLGRDRYEPEYVPRALEKLEIEVVVRLRHSGFLLAMTSAGPSPAAIAIRNASHQAMELVVNTIDGARDLLPEIMIEIEATGKSQYFTVDQDWTLPGALDAYIEPGVHGMVLVGPTIHHRFCPTEIFTSNRKLSEALKDIAIKSQSTPAQITKTKLMRFRSLHWIQEKPGAAILTLLRGMKTIPLEAVNEKEIDLALVRLADYMIYRQQDSGLFSYEYEPALNTYTKENNVVRQVGVTFSMAMHARWSGHDASRSAASLAIQFHRQGLTKIPHVDNAVFMATADKKNKLGVTALLCLAMIEHPQTEQYTQEIEKLINAMLWLQRPSGMFVTAFPPAEEIKSQDDFPGMALYAMARQYEHHPSAQISDTFDRAIKFYRNYFAKHRSPAFVPWQTQAFSIMARRTKRKDYADYVFEMTDWLAAKQLNPSNCPWPQLWGGVAGYASGRPDVSTAAILAGFADALSLARFVGDEERVNRYEKSVRQAARFVMQLQVRPEEAYFIRSPLDAIGGIRATPSLPRLRIDHCQHAMTALIKTQRTLYSH